MSLDLSFVVIQKRYQSAIKFNSKKVRPRITQLRRQTLNFDHLFFNELLKRPISRCSRRLS